MVGCDLARVAAVAVLIASFFLPGGLAVDAGKFKRCQDSGFCRRNRAFGDGSSKPVSFRLDPASIKIGADSISAFLYQDIASIGLREYPLKIRFAETGGCRITIDETARLEKEAANDGGQVRWNRYNETEKWALVDDVSYSTNFLAKTEDNKLVVDYGHDEQLRFTYNPLKIEFTRNGATNIVLNEKELMNIEYMRSKNDEAEDKDGLWEEKFLTFTDSKLRGPEAIAMDIQFFNYTHVFGIPEHSAEFSLKGTRSQHPSDFDQPYRLFNLDVFEYEYGPMALYGAIPFLQARRSGMSAGVFWMSASETWIDISKKLADKDSSVNTYSEINTHWISESGVLDFFVFQSSEPHHLLEQYIKLVGTPMLPPLWSTAYHQCRWNYRDQKDVETVNQNFDHHGIPYDTIWLDIEYTDHKKYFTWNTAAFPSPEKILDDLNETKRKLVIIIDPHIKVENGYSVYNEAIEQDVVIKTSGNTPLEGWCWPGNSVWIDYLNQKATEFWASWISRIPGWRPNLWLWDDMNEPSVFSGPELTAPKDSLHHGGWENRDIHNIYGHSMIVSSFNGLLQRQKNTRPFILTRAFYSGTQRYGAVWTGDNAATWESLASSMPMILSMSISGYPFVGADVGGFFGNPSKELLVRWYQVGAFFPFFRAHAHIDTQRREPWLMGEPHSGLIKDAIRMRYKLLPTLYTAFREANLTGMPVLRPQYFVFPDDEAGYSIEDQFYVGSSGILVKPVTAQGVQSVAIYLSDAENYYDYHTYKKFVSPGSKTVSVKTPLEKIAIVMRGGHIFARRDRVRRSSDLMAFDPFTLVITVSSKVIIPDRSMKVNLTCKKGPSRGELYVDDGISFDFLKGAYIHQNFTFDPNTDVISGTTLHSSGKMAFTNHLFIERIIILGLENEYPVNEVTCSVQQKGKKWTTEAIVNKTDGSIVIRKPSVLLTSDWRIELP